MERLLLQIRNNPHTENGQRNQNRTTQKPQQRPHQPNPHPHRATQHAKKRTKPVNNTTTKRKNPKRTKLTSLTLIKPTKFINPYTKRRMKQTNLGFLKSLTPEKQQFLLTGLILTLIYILGISNFFFNFVP